MTDAKAKIRWVKSSIGSQCTLCANRNVYDDASIFADSSRTFCILSILSYEQ